MSTAPLTAWPRPPRAAPASREASWHLPRRWETRTSQPHRRPDDEEGPRRASVRYALDPGHDQPTHPPRCSSLSSWSKHEAPAGATRGTKRSAQRKTPPSRQPGPPRALKARVEPPLAQAAPRSNQPRHLSPVASRPARANHHPRAHPPPFPPWRGGQTCACRLLHAAHQCNDGHARSARLQGCASLQLLASAGPGPHAWPTRRPCRDSGNGHAAE